MVVDLQGCGAGAKICSFVLRGFQLSCGYLGAILELFCLGQFFGWSLGVSGTCRALLEVGVGLPGCAMCVVSEVGPCLRVL